MIISLPLMEFYMDKEKKLPYSVLRAIDTVRASGGVISEDAIELMCLVDSGEISGDEAVLRVIEREQLTAVNDKK